MAKTARAKKQAEINPRSRAAKRAASPSLNVDKSVTAVPRAADASPLLGLQPHGNGIQKSKKKVKPMKRGQRVRQERGLARAEIVLDQLEKKKEFSQVKSKRVRGRRAVWEEINEGANEERRKTPKLLGMGNGHLEEQGRREEGGEGEWEDETDGGDTDMKLVDGVQVPANAALTKVVVAVRAASNNGSDLEDIT